MTPARSCRVAGQEGLTPDDGDALRDVHDGIWKKEHEGGDGGRLVGVATLGGTLRFQMR